MHRGHFCIVFLFLCLWSCDALACSTRYSSPEDQYKEAISIFEGEVIDVVITSERTRRVSFRVDKTYKGIAGDRMELGAGSGYSSCEINFEKGKKYIVFVGGDYPQEPKILQSGRTYLLRGNQGDNEKLRIFETAMRQRDAIDAIAAKTGNNDALLMIKAKHFLYWKDFQQAEVFLQDLIKRNKKNLWAIDRLMFVLYKQHKARKIRDFLETDAAREIPDIQNRNRGEYHTEAIGQAISLAFLLSKDMNMPSPILLGEVTLKNIEKTSMVFRGFSADKVVINRSDFSDSDFSKARIDSSNFFETNFSGSYFFNAQIEGTHFSRVDFSKADLSNTVFLNSEFVDVNFKDAFMKGLQLNGSVYDCKTIWPSNFDPVAAGAKLMSECN